MRIIILDRVGVRKARAAAERSSYGLLFVDVTVAIVYK